MDFVGTTQSGQPGRALRLGRWCGMSLVWLLVHALLSADADQSPEAMDERPSAWVSEIAELDAKVRKSRWLERRPSPEWEKVWRRFQDDFPVAWDWLMQDADGEYTRWFTEPPGSAFRNAVLGRLIKEAGTEESGLRLQVDGLMRSGAGAGAREWFEVYGRACELRRRARLKDIAERAPRIVFTRRHTIRPSFFAYTEGQSDAQNERHFLPGAALCLVELDGARTTVRTLLADPTGVIRDPAVSWDGRRVLFAWKKSLDGDDYHLYELEVADGRVRQLTSGIGFADYEGAYLPSGDLIFASTRCVQTVDCWWTEVSNLYTCDREGRFLRRLGFDQVHTVYPTVLEDGRVIYTRWDYNDRGQIFPQALFQMNPDGTGQGEFYGNSSWFPTTIAHARGIPGTQKVIATLCGHHTAQAGKLAIINPASGRQENRGVQLVAPVRSTPAERKDDYGQEGELFAYPFALDETQFLVTYAPLGWAWRDGHFGIYWMDADGRRELLAFDADRSCSHPVPLRSTPTPPFRASNVDYQKGKGVYYVQDIYQGTGLADVPRGSVKRLRVVALDFRAAGVGHNFSEGPSGGALISTPIAIGNGSWDVKVVLGTTPVHEDGSAYFLVPARTPVYFQALDERGYAIQTMRSWSTLQPGEIQACVGCHEHKNSAPCLSASVTLALSGGLRDLDPFLGPARGFSFPHEIQPILDRHCVRCHNDRGILPPADSSAELRSKAGSVTGSALGATVSVEAKPAFSLLSEPVLDEKAKRYWSDAYLALTGGRRRDLPWEREVYVGDCNRRLVNWISSQSVPDALAPYSAGAARSGLMKLLEGGHQGVRLGRDEVERLACWIDLLVPYCGDYIEANAWSHDERQKYERFTQKRQAMETFERANIQAWILDRKEDAR